MHRVRPPRRGGDRLRARRERHRLRRVRPQQGQVRHQGGGRRQPPLWVEAPRVGS